MYFDSLQAALLMDGHGSYVWSAYLLTLLVIAGLLVYPRRRQRRLLREVRGETRRRGERPSASPGTVEGP